MQKQMENFDISKIFYDKEIGEEHYRFLKEIDGNPMLIFTKHKNKSFSPNIDYFIEKFLGIDPKNEEQPDYIKMISKTSPNVQRIFVMVGYFFLSNYAFKNLEVSNLQNCKGKFELSGNSDEDLILYLLLKYSGAKRSPNKNDSTIFNIGYINALCSPIFGKCLKSLLKLRFSKALGIEINNDKFYDICHQANFNTALGISTSVFRSWLEGENVGTYIQDIKIQDFICISDIEMCINKAKEVYILGENGDGKTLILNALFLTFAGRTIENASVKEASDAIEMLRIAKEMQSMLEGSDNLNVYGPQSFNYLPNLYAYGTHRGRTSSIENADKLGFMSLFGTDYTLVDPSAWIKEICFREMMNARQLGDSITTASQNTISAIQDILDTLLDKKIKIDIDIDFNNNVIYNENGATLNFSELSEGYRTTLIFVCDLLYRFYGYKMPKDFNGVFDAKGVVLIDEIDAHLHPRWQRTIVSRIRKLFPEVQFIMTTHSPHIIQGAGQDAVIFRVYRDGESGKTCVSEPYLRSELNYMMINTLATSPLFGLESARLKVDNETDYTSSTYLMDRIEKKVQDRIKKSNLKNLITDDMIDNIIDSVLDEDDN